MIYYSEPIKLEVKGRSVFVNGEVKDFSVRNFSEMNDVLMKRQTVHHDYPFYFMFRSIIQKEGLRYDITLIPTKNIDGEYAKTYGHYHPIAEDNLTYPEIYQVLDGTALFLLQKLRNDETVDVIVTYGEKGQVLLIPPNWGHTTINPSKNNMLVLSNLVSDSFESSYAKYKENRGAAYYFTDFGLEQNPNYIIRSTEKKKADQINFKYGFECSDLLKEFVANPDRFEFLKKPSLIAKA